VSGWFERCRGLGWFGPWLKVVEGTEEENLSRGYRIGRWMEGSMKEGGREGRKVGSDGLNSSFILCQYSTKCYPGSGGFL